MIIDLDIGRAPKQHANFLLMSDQDLMAAVVSGRVAAFAELYTRYREIAYQHAEASLGCRAGCEDLVQEGFTNLLARLCDGTQSHPHFGRDLRICMDSSMPDVPAEASSGLGTDLPEPRAADPDLASLEQQRVLCLAREAYLSLPRRWRSLLTRLELEGQSVRAMAGHLGIDPVTAAVIVSMAVESLRIAYLRTMTPKSAPPECRPAVSFIASWMCGRLPQRTREQVSRHVADCPFCEDVVIELREVRNRMPSTSLPWPVSLNDLPIRTASREYPCGEESTAPGACDR